MKHINTKSIRTYNFRYSCYTTLHFHIDKQLQH